MRTTAATRLKATSVLANAKRLFQDKKKTFRNLGAFVVRVFDRLAAAALVPVGVAAVAHEPTHIVGAVLRGRTGLAELADFTRTGTKKMRG